MKKRNILILLASALITIPYFINIYSPLRLLSFIIGYLIIIILLFKYKKNFIINLIVIISISFSLYFIDYYLACNNRMPFMIEKVNSSEKVITYYSLLYQINICDNKWNIDLFYRNGYTCSKEFLKEISINEFLNKDIIKNNQYIKIKGKISEINGVDYIELKPYEQIDNAINGDVKFKEDFIFRLSLENANIDLAQYKIYDEISFIGKIFKKDGDIYYFTDVIIYPSEIYQNYKISLTKDNRCEFDKTLFVEVDDLKYYKSCLKDIKITFGESNIYDLDYVLLDKKITIDDLVTKSVMKESDSENNTLYKIDELSYIVCSNKDIIFGKDLTLKNNDYCIVDIDEGV